MSYRIHSKDVVIEVDSQLELQNVLRLLQVTPKKDEQYTPVQQNRAPMRLHSAGLDDDSQHDGNDSQVNHVNGSMEGSEDDDELGDSDQEDTPDQDEDDEALAAQVAVFMATIPEGQRRLLELLARVHPKGYNDAVIRAHLDLKTNHDLGGLLTGLTKNAKRGGFRPFVFRQKARGKPGVKYAYFLNDKYASLIKKPDKESDDEG